MNFEAVLKKVVAFLGSFGLACIILLLLFLIVLFGTLEQGQASLYEVQKRYFESFIATGGMVPVPLPGGALLLSLLFVNLMVGGIVRMRRTWSRVGIFIIHAGIAILLLGGLIEYRYSDKGHMTLFEGQASDEFQSYHEWEVVVAEQLPGGKERAYVIPDNELVRIDTTRKVSFHAEALPFTVELTGFLPNCQPRPASGDGGIDGFELVKLPPEMENERNIAGVTVTLVEPTGTRQQSILWGVQRTPWEVKAAGKRWAIDLRRRRWELPFEVQLAKFTRKLHPRTGMASYFSSDITRREGGVATDIHISMNEPMRHEGYTFYQSGWGPQDAPPGSRLFSTFSVVKNPSDRVPLWSTVIIAIGLLVHFLTKLSKHISTEAKKRS